jgi:hypothetical protein
MDFLGTEAKPTFKKRVHRPWNSKLLDAVQSDILLDPSLADQSEKLVTHHTSINSLPNQDSDQFRSELQSAMHTHVNQLYENNISIGGFLRLPTREKDDQSPNLLTAQIHLPILNHDSQQPWKRDLEMEKRKNEILLSEKEQLLQQINQLHSEFAENKNAFTHEVAELHTQLKLLTSEKDACEADYQNALQYLQQERIEREQLRNDLLLETQALQTETTRRVQAERNESLLSETLANFEAESALLEKSKKNLEADTKALVEKRIKMDAINENEQKLRKLYEDKMKALHEKVFQLERQLKVENEQKHSLELKIAQFFENMKSVESEKKEIESQNFMMDQEIKLQQNQIVDLESKLKDEMKVRRAFESTFSDALSKN